MKDEFLKELLTQIRKMSACLEPGDYPIVESILKRNAKKLLTSFTDNSENSLFGEESLDFLDSDQYYPVAECH